MISGVELWIGRDVDRFSAQAGRFVTERIERNVLATVLSAVQSGDYAEAIFAVASDAHGAPVGVALRTPPHHLLAAGSFDDPQALLEAWRGVDPDPPGISAEPALARTLAEAWAALTGGSIERQVSEALHVLERVIPPARPAPGRLRPAGFRDRAQLGEWGAAFAVDAGIPHVDATAARVQDAIEHQRVYVWDLDGQSVAMVGHSVAVAGAVRVGPVYTPPQRRGRGYATAATAALSQRLLDRGAERCLLYTDLSNPISNHIYAKLGYVRIGDWEEFVLIPEVL